MTILLIAVLGVALLAGVAWFFWPVTSRRTREQKDPATQFHWGVVTTYMGLADPTLLPVEEARSILQGGWSCPDPDAVRRKMSLYRQGEVNTAFDVARIVWLSELCLAAQWFTAQEHAQWCREALARVSAAYPSWVAFGDDLAVGRRRWWTEVARSEMPANDQQRAMESRKTAEALWPTIAWGAR
jgi:hypothetical protein